MKLCDLALTVIKSKFILSTRHSPLVFSFHKSVQHLHSTTCQYQWWMWLQQPGINKLGQILQVFPYDRAAVRKKNAALWIVHLWELVGVHESKTSIRAYPGFCTMRRLRVPHSPLHRMLVHWRVTPCIKFASNHLYNWVERVMCLALEHNTMTRVGALTAWTQTAPSGVSFGLCISHVLF